MGEEWSGVGGWGGEEGVRRERRKGEEGGAVVWGVCVCVVVVLFLWVSVLLFLFFFFGVRVVLLL